MKTVKQVGTELKKFAKKLVGNRVFDLYLKYKGVKTLTSATLVPFALVMGRDAFKKFMKVGILPPGCPLKSICPIDIQLLYQSFQFTYPHGCNCCFFQLS